MSGLRCLPSKTYTPTLRPHSGLAAQDEPNISGMDGAMPRTLIPDNIQQAINPAHLSTVSKIPPNQTKLEMMRENETPADAVMEPKYWGKRGLDDCSSSKSGTCCGRRARRLPCSMEIWLHTPRTTTFQKQFPKTLSQMPMFLVHMAMKSKGHQMCDGCQVPPNSHLDDLPLSLRPSKDDGQRFPMVPNVPVLNMCFGIGTLSLFDISP